MIKLLAFQLFGLFLQNLLGTEFFAAVKQGVEAAMLWDKPGEERKRLVLDSLQKAKGAGQYAAAQTANWAINLAIEFAVAQIKLRAPETK